MNTERNYIQEMRERDFLNKFDKVIKQMIDANITYKTTKVCIMVSRQPAPCFYVSLEQALYQYRLFKHGKSHIKNEERRKMYAEIFARFENLMDMAGGEAYQYQIMDIVLQQEAPSFYLNEASALQFYYNAVKNKRIKARNK